MYGHVLQTPNTALEQLVVSSLNQPTRHFRLSWACEEVSLMAMMKS